MQPPVVGGGGTIYVPVISAEKTMSIKDSRRVIWMPLSASAATVTMPIIITTDHLGADMETVKTIGK